MAWNRRSLFQCLAVAAALLAGCAGTSSVPDLEARALLAPSGKLRVGGYRGSPTSILRGGAGPQQRWVSILAPHR